MRRRQSLNMVTIEISVNGDIVTTITNQCMAIVKQEFIEFIAMNLEWSDTKSDCTDWLEGFLGQQDMDTWDYHFSNGSILFTSGMSLSTLRTFIRHWNSDVDDGLDVSYRIKYS